MNHYNLRLNYYNLDNLKKFFEMKLNEGHFYYI